MNYPRKRNAGFSLVEVLAAVAIIGIIAFLALPNIVAIKDESEIHLAISRAEAANMAMVSFIQSRGRATAVNEWDDADSAQEQYALLAPYLAFAPTNVTDYMPSGYTIELPDSLSSLSKVVLKDPEDAAISY